MKALLLMLCAASLAAPSILAAVTPVYTAHNYVAGDTETMTNISTWAATVATSPSAPVTETAIAYQKDGSAITVNVDAGGTLTADVTDWVEGQSQTAIITLASGAYVNASLVLVGYTTWTTDTPFIAACIYVDGKVYVYPVSSVK